MHVNNPIDGVDGYGGLGLNLENLLPVGDSYIVKGLVNGYSLSRKLVSTATNSLRVRRGSDNAEQDVGFDNNDFDNSSLTTFIGANDGLVVTLYDQVGSLDLTQSTTTLQSRIVSSGTIEVIPSTSINTMIKLVASGDNSYSSSSSGLSQFSVFYLATSNSTSSARPGSASTERIWIREVNNRLRVRIDNNTAPDGTNTLTDDVPYVVAVKWRASDGQVIATVNTLDDLDTILSISGLFTFSEIGLFNGDSSRFTELMFFNTYLSDSDLDTISSEMLTNYSLPSSI